MELYVLTHIDACQFEGNIETLVGVYDELSKVVEVANEKGYTEFHEHEGVSWDNFYMPVSHPDYDRDSFLFLERVTLNETKKEEE